MASRPEPGGVCHVSFLVPHPGRTAVLVAEHAPPLSLLPTVVIRHPEPTVTAILASVEGIVPSTAVVLRQVVTSETDEGETALLVELDAGSTQPPPGWAWLELDAAEVAGLDPVTAREAVAAWARERAEGWSPLRPAWSRPGWFAQASAWMVGQMAADGRPATGRPRQHQLWDVSVVLRAPSANGDAYLKCSAGLFRHEAAVTQALAARMPGAVPDVVAVDAERGWMLMRDLGAPELGDQDETFWGEGVAAHARIQRSWLERVDELVGLGVQVRSLPALASEADQMAADPVLLDRMSAELRERWLAAAPHLVEACRRLDQLGPGPSLVHGDFHPWNVTSGPRGTRVFDWTDAAVSHPFVDLATYVFRTEDAAVRRQLLTAYVEAWAGMAPEETLHEAAALGLVVGALYQVQTYRSLLPELPRHGADAGLAGADLDWINRSLTRLERGIESPV